MAGDEVTVTLYRWAGAWGPFKVGIPCGECALTKDVLQDTFENELAGIPVRLEVREWLSEWWRPLPRGGSGRAGYPVARDGKALGTVTSGAPSPTLGKSIGLAYVPPDLAAAGTRLEVMIRGRAAPARVVETPFVNPDYP